MRAFLFPGQGSQRVGMGIELASAFTAARRVFQEVDDTLNQKLSALMWEGTESELALTENAQPAIMAVSLAVIRVLETELNRPFSSFADFAVGHSLGEYSAIAAARTIKLSDAAQLLKKRGRAMQEAVPVGIGAMAALIGIEADMAETVVRDASSAMTPKFCTIANDNGAGQIVLSGHTEAVEQAIAIASKLGVRRAVKLPVSAPFHCPLMAPAKSVMLDALSITRFEIPSLPIITNVTASPETNPEHLRTALIKQITEKVRWRESMEKLIELGIDSLVEAGVGRVLAGLARRITKEASITSVVMPQEIDALLKEL